MRRIFLLCITIVLCTDILAQQPHFIYLQTDNKQPFYLKLNNKLYSSSASGYLIVPKLTDGEYQLVIGFPRNEWPEQNFSYTVDRKDAGFLVKNFNERGWGLFNLQSLDVLMSVKKTEVDNVVMKDKNDAFADMLSDVVNDPAIKQTKIIKTEEKPEVTQVVQDTVASANDQPAEVPKPAASIVKSFAKENNGALEMQYIDLTNTVADTISLIIQNDLPVGVTDEIKTVLTDTIAKAVDEKKLAITDVVAKAADENSLAVTDTVGKLPQENTITVADSVVKAITDEKPVSQTKFLDIELANPNDSARTVATVPVIKNDQVIADSVVKIGNSTVEITSIDNATCHNVAHKEDLVKLRKKMLAASNIDEMIAAARKFFRTKCYTTQQIREISDLILGDEDRYRFFDAAYPFVSDTKRFYTLEDLLKDQYYINRFRAMIRQ